MTTEQHPDPDNPPSSDEYVPSRVVDLPDGFVHEDDDEAFDAGDDPDAPIDWDQVAVLQGRVDEVLAIEHPDQRREGARWLAAELAGEEVQG